MASSIESTLLRRNKNKNNIKSSTRGDDEINNNCGLYLAPIRHGDLLVPPPLLSSRVNQDSITGNESTSSRTTRNIDSQIPLGWIPLDRCRRNRCDRTNDKDNVNGNEWGDVILGRSDFLSSMFSACGCSKNVKSSRNKCRECRSVLAWAGNLSRNTLKITNINDTTNQKPEIKVSFRGSLAAILIINNDRKGEKEDVTHRRHCRCLDCRCYCGADENDASLALMLASTSEENERDDAPMRDPRKWGKHKRVCRGSKISLRYGEDNLDFMVVSERYLQSSAAENMNQSETNRGGNSDGGSVSNNSNKTRSNYSCSRITNVPNDLVDSRNQSIGKYFKPFQQVQQEAKQGYNCLNQTSQISETSVLGNANNDFSCSPFVTRIWFCPRGQDMPRKRIDILTNRLLSSSININNNIASPSLRHGVDVQVVDRCFDATHWIISERVADLASVAKALPAANTTEETLKKFLDEHDIECLKPSWFDFLFSSSKLSKLSTFDLLPRPSAMDRWYGYVSAKKQQRGTNHNERSYKRQRMCRDSPLRNLIISEFFLKLSKIYEQTPYLPDDDMKARQYHLIAGRLQKIDFDIVSDTTNQELKAIPFVGVSTAQMIREIIQTNRLRRLENLRKDPIRMAMRDLMAIWGVGRATALSLIHQGYLKIDQVREGISTGRLSCFDRRQLIGVKCYEDLLEDMSRTEVEIIFEQILIEARKILPSCEAQIMGSYRRGKCALGDLDVLIVSKQYRNKIPGRFLPELVNALWRKGRIAYNLNRLPGLQKGSDAISQEESDYRTFQDDLPSSSKASTNKIRKSAETTGSATYMGIFLSPTVPGKRRRVDIKMWPYSQKPYASLYFTGGKYFNRSMRQWANSKFNWKLDDKGLFDRMTGERVIIVGCTEEDVFNKLQLVYKAPPDRIFFDDVHPLT